MKQILYFLIGLLIPIILFKASYADACVYNYNDLSLDIWKDSGYKGVAEAAGYSLATVGVYSDSTSANTARGDYLNSNGFAGESYNVGSEGLQSTDETAIIAYYYIYSSTRSAFYVFIYWISGEACEVKSDTDGDGIPDDEDMYPNDSTPYSVKLVTYFTADGTANGTHVGEIWVTDRGDYFKVGDLPEDGLGGFFVPDGTWQDPSSGGGPAMGTPTTTEGSGIQKPTYSTDLPTGDAPEGNDPTGQSGTASAGTETDTQALYGIMDNTGAAANNTKRQLDYMKDLNKAIQNMDRNIASMSEGGTAIIAPGEPSAQEKTQEAETAKNNFDSVSVSDHYSGISGDLIEGEDYQLPGDLADESFITDFLSSNPLIAAFQNSGFEVSSSSPIATLDLGDLGSHQIDLSPLESGFQLAGNMLFALCSIGSLILVVRG